MANSTNERPTPAAEQPPPAADTPAAEQPAAAADAPAANAPAAEQPAAAADAPAANAPVAEQPAAAADAPITEQPAAAADAPVTEQPAAAADAPVTEQPAAAADAPAANAPVAEQPAAAADAPAANAPVAEQPAATADAPAANAPVAEQPAAAADAPAANAPVAEQPAAAADAPAANAPVAEQPAAAADAPVTEQPAAAADAPAANAPVAEQPAAAADAPAANAPVAEQPAAAADTPAAGAPAEQPRPYLTCVDRVLKLPLVEAAITKSTGLYSRVKGSNVLLKWSLSTAEGASKLAIHIAGPFTYPMLVILRQPIRVVDWSLCKGLDVAESVMPIITVPPQQVYDMAKERIDNVKAFGTNTARSLADLSWHKANEVLKTRYGTLAFQSFDLTAETAEKFFDLLVPPAENEQQLDDAKEQDPDDRVAIAVYTVGRLSNKMVKRVYNKISTEIKQLEKEKDKFPLYFHSLVALLSLTTYINSYLGKAPQGDQTAATSSQGGTAQQPANNASSQSAGTVS